MEKQFRIAVLVAFVIVCSTITAKACDICGAFIGVTPYDNQSGFSIYHRYSLFSRIDAIESQPLIPQGAYRLQPTMSVLHTHSDSASLQEGDFESYKVIELRGKWFLHSRVELNALIPFVMTKSRMNSSLEEASGFGDAAFWVGFHVIRRVESTIKQRLILGAGIKFPTGNGNQGDDDGTRYHLYLQPGTGSFDETAYLQYSIGIGKFGSALNFTAKHNGENQFGEQIQPSLSTAVNLFWMFRKDKTVVLPQFQFTAEHTSGYTVNGVFEDQSEMGLIMGGAGCDAYFGRMGIHFTAQVPLAELKSETSPSATFRGVLGVSWNINQQNYLLN